MKNEIKMNMEYTREMTIVCPTALRFMHGSKKQALFDADRKVPIDALPRTAHQHHAVFCPRMHEFLLR
jgi:hypothetical protein